MGLTSSCSSRGWLALALAAAPLLAAAGVRADTGDDTDAAFAALLAMPGAQPKEGAWVIPEQDEPTPEGEAALLARLQRLQRAGANVNAYRHGGTLLAHAIRAGKERTAIWLLRHGADPRHVLYPYDRELSAYDLARRYQRKAVLKLLEGRYGFKPPAPTAPAGVALKGKALPAGASAQPPAEPPSREQQALALMERLLGPTRSPNEAAQREWQAFAATLSAEQYSRLFKDGAHLDALVLLALNTEDGLEEALSRLPLDLVRAHAQGVADVLIERSFATYSEGPTIRYSVAARSWPALWRRLDRPLRYDQGNTLAGNLPPALWPGLFASGYARHDAEVTGCLLSALDAPAFKALWPEFQRYFADARQEAPGLVLHAYRLDRSSSPCNYISAQADTAEKLSFLRQQGVTQAVTGLHQFSANETIEPALAAMVAAYTAPTQPVSPPRLVKAPPACELALDGVWLDALIQFNLEDSWLGPPAKYVQAIDVPGQDSCGIVISADGRNEDYRRHDDFFEGPSIDGGSHCAGLPETLSVLIEEAARIRSLDMVTDPVAGIASHEVLDTRTGKHYFLNEGLRGPDACWSVYTLPDAYEWQTGPQGASLIVSPDATLIDRLLREQCHEVPDSNVLVCRGVGPLTAGIPDATESAHEDVLVALHQGELLSIHQLVDHLGAQRRKAYAAAIAAHDHAGLRQLLARGISPRWTGEEIRALGSADLPLDEKRRRIALLLANPDQLDRTLNQDRYDLPKALLAWLPDQDWQPVLRAISRSQALWLDAADRLRKAAAEANRPSLACEIDRAQGFLCGGGIVF